MKIKSGITLTLVTFFIFVFSSCSFTREKKQEEILKPTSKNSMSAKKDTAVFGAGCFWCVEAIFQELKGVESVESGYTGGTTVNPTYKEVCSGNTGHAEVAKIVFDPSVISYKELLEVFWTTHDPTTLNKQGADIGTQYRSSIFYTGDEQKKEAELSKKETAPQFWDGGIVTVIEPLTVFYKAEDYHQNYYNENSGQSYCQFVINPKLEKFRKKYRNKLKDQ